MKHYFLLFFMLVLIHLGFTQNIDADTFINRIEMSYTLEMVEEKLQELDNVKADDKSPEALTKAFLLFRKSLLTNLEEDTRRSFEFVNTLYETTPEFQNSVILAMCGANEASIAGSLTSPNPIPKLDLLGKGMKKLDKALEEQTAQNNKDHLAMGYIYFLRGRTTASVPNFLEQSKETPDNLKKALDYYKKLDSISPNLIANIFYAYGLYFVKLGKIRTGLKNMEKARDYADEYFKLEINDRIETIQ